MDRKIASAVSALRALEAEVSSVAFEREDEITLASLALLTGEHVVYLGEPGVGKSHLVRAINARITSARLFECALHPQMSADDVRGAPDLPKLGQGVYEYQVAGRMMDVEILFLDEVFKAPPSTLNVMLSALNERVFHNGGRVDKIPLRSAFAASNELPRAGECDALWDRFLFRTYTHALRNPANAARLFTGDTPNPPITATIPLADLDALRGAVKGVAMPDDTVKAALAIRDEIRGAGIMVSDRRFTAWGRAVRASALRDGRDATTLEDLSCGEHVLWLLPDQARKVRDVVNKHALPTLGRVLAILDQATEIAKTASRPEATAEERARAGATLRLKLEEAQSHARGSTHARVLDAVKKVEGQRDAVRRALNALT